jgi:hypothetical protein
MAIVAVTTIASNGANASTIYRNLSGGYYCCEGYTISGSSSLPGGPNTFAVDFTSLETAGVSQIDIALEWVEGTNGAIVSLWTAGFGMELWNVNVFNLPRFDICYQPPSVTCSGSDSLGLKTISGISGVNVIAGDSYILQVTPLSLTNDTWAVWNTNSNITAGAFDIIHTTPLPAAFPLFATGLGALGLFGWRRKRKSSVAFAVDRSRTRSATAKLKAQY